MKKHVSLLFAVCALWVLTFSGHALAGKITGTIKVSGLPSPENIVVYITQSPPVSVDLSGAKVVMDQRNLTFVPHVLPVLVGTAVLFPNNDNVNHNVFSLSRTKQFNLGSYPRGESKTVVFDQPGIVELRCDVHADMQAFILVMENPYWAVTDSNGHFTIPDAQYFDRSGIKGIKDLAPGTYTIKTWHEKLKTGHETVTVPENGDVSVEIHLTRGAPGVLYKR